MEPSLGSGRGEHRTVLKDLLGIRSTWYKILCRLLFSEKSDDRSLECPITNVLKKNRVFGVRNCSHMCLRNTGLSIMIDFKSEYSVSAWGRPSWRDDCQQCSLTKRLKPFGSFDTFPTEAGHAWRKKFENKIPVCFKSPENLRGLSPPEQQQLVWAIKRYHWVPTADMVRMSQKAVYVDLSALCQWFIALETNGDKKKVMGTNFIGDCKTDGGCPRWEQHPSRNGKNKVTLWVSFSQI